MVVEMVRFSHYDIVTHYWGALEFNFAYEGFGWLPRLSPLGYHCLVALLGLLALGICLGFCYRFCCLSFTLGYTYLFLLEKSVYNNHYYLIALLGLLLSVIDGHRWASLDARRLELSPTVPAWQLYLLRFQLVVVYFYGGVAKLNPDWLAGQPLGLWLEDTRLDSVAVVYLLTYGGLFFDLWIGYLLLWPRTRLAAMVVATAFHLTNLQLFTIGIFPYLGIASLVVFCEPDEPRRWLGQKRLPPRAGPLALRSTTLLLLAAYVTLQVLVPLRHWLYPGPVEWNERGHRFSWRMKLRSKRGVVKVEMVRPATGEVQDLSSLPHLTSRQSDKMAGRPDMQLQYARYLRSRYASEGEPAAQFHFFTQVSLNGREPEPLIDATVDLARQSYSGFERAAWIAPAPTDHFSPHRAVRPALTAASVLCLLGLGFGFVRSRSSIGGAQDRGWQGLLCLMLASFVGALLVLG